MKRNARRALTDLGLDPRNRDVTAELMTSAENKLTNHRRNDFEAVQLPPFEFASRERQQLTSSNDLSVSTTGKDPSSSVTQSTCSPFVRSSPVNHPDLRSRRSFARSRSPALMRYSTQCERPKDGDADKGKEHSVLDCDSFENQLTIKEKGSKGHRLLQRSKTFESISSFRQRRT